MTEFEFDPVAAARIEEVVNHYPLSLKHCAELLEIIAPLVENLSASGACKFLQEVVDIRCNEAAPVLLEAMRQAKWIIKV